MAFRKGSRHMTFKRRLSHIVTQQVSFTQRLEEAGYMDAQDTALVAAKDLDPRFRRSRQMLHEALATLLQTKEFDKISIQDIAETSTLNRATFYDHYPHKSALLACMIGSRFAALMVERNVQVDDCAGALRAIALGVCEYLAQMPSRAGGSHEGSVQMAIVGVIRGMLLEGLRSHDLSANVSSEVVASAVAWAIYGAVSAWVQSSDRCSAEKMSGAIEDLIKPVLMGAAADDSGAKASRKRRRTERRRQPSLRKV